MLLGVLFFNGQHAVSGNAILITLGGLLMKVKALILSLSFVCLGSLVMSQATWANLLTDPGFESQTSAPNPNPNGIPGWATFGGAGFSNTLANTGSWSMLMNGAPGGYFVPGAFENLAANAGD